MSTTLIAELIKRLNEVQPNSWGEKLKEIKKYIEKYDEERRGPSNYSKADIIAYLNKILPTYWDVFHTHNTARRRDGELDKRDGTDEARLPRYDIGIFLVGYSPIPIALSLAEIQPCEEIYFLYSSDTKPILLDIGDRLRKMLDGSYTSFVDRVETTALSNQENDALAIDKPSDPVSTFKRIKEIVDSIDAADNKRIALDLTGGKKTMLGGGYTAGAIWASRWSAASQKLMDFCDMYYIDSLEYDQSRGSPVPGTEFLSRLENPYAVYNVESNLQARKLFEKRNYEAAADLWENVESTLKEHKKRYGLETEFNITVNQHGMAKCYYLWDSFDYNEANQNKGDPKNKNWGYFKKHVHNSIDVLSILSNVTSRSMLFQNERVIIHYAVDRYQNGMRRKESGKLEDAIVRFAQVIEMICHYWVYRLSQDGYFVDIMTKAPCQLSATEIWEFNPINLLFENKPEDVPLQRITCHLKANKKIEATDYGYNNVDEIFKVIEPRHDFIHFNNPQRSTQAETDTETLRELAHKFLENFLAEYCSKYGLDLKDLLELHRFRRLTE